MGFCLNTGVCIIQSTISRDRIYMYMYNYCNQERTDTPMNVKFDDSTVFISSARLVVLVYESLLTPVLQNKRYNACVHVTVIVCVYTCTLVETLALLCLVHVFVCVI